MRSNVTDGRITSFFCTARCHSVQTVFCREHELCIVQRTFSRRFNITDTLYRGSSTTTIVHLLNPGQTGSIDWNPFVPINARRANSINQRFVRPRGNSQYRDRIVGHEWEYSTRWSDFTLSSSKSSWCWRARIQSSERRRFCCCCSVKLVDGILRI